MSETRTDAEQGGAERTLREWADVWAAPGDSPMVDAMRAAADEIDALRTRYDEAIGLLARIRAWDHLDTAGDGAFWKREIDAALSRATGASNG